MPRLDESRGAILDALLDRYGPLSPTGGGLSGGSTPFEALASAALNRIAEPRVAATAFELFRQAGFLEPATLAGADATEIEELLRASKLKIEPKSLRPLRRLAGWIADRGFDAEQAGLASTESLREEWRLLNGIGPATADALLLRGLRRVAYPVDRATYRILIRHGWLDATVDYEDARSVAEGLAPDDPDTLALLSERMARVGRDYCKSTRALCERCPLRPMLPPGGPAEVGE